MKTIELDIREFENFKQLAKRLNIMFMFQIMHGQIFVEANAEKLEELGF